MKLSMICVVLAALAAVANAGSIDIKVQDKSIAITPTEDAWQQLVAPLSKAESKCCTTCTAPKNKYFSIAHDSGKWLCGETCIRDGFFPIFHIFEKNLTKAASRTASVCADAGYTVYDSTVTHGGGGLDCTLDLYACSKGEGNCEHPPATTKTAKIAAAPAVGKVATACGIQYTTVNDAWRAIGNECCSDMSDDGRCLGPNVTDRSGWLIPTPNKTVGFKNMGDSQGTAQSCPNAQESHTVGGDRWFRFEGAGGDALPLAPPPGGFGDGPESCNTDPVHNPWPPHGRLYCGTTNPGWLSGWKWPAKPDCSSSRDCPYTIQGENIECTPRGCAPGDRWYGGGQAGHITRTPLGRYPTAEEGVVNMTACFVGFAGGGGGLGSCADYATVGVARCEDFLLWRLPYTPGCSADESPAAYCTVNAAGRLL